MVGAANELGGLACPPASGAEPECYEELPGQCCGVSLRNSAHCGCAHDENHPAGGLVHSPPLKCLRGHTHRDRMSITGSDEIYTVQKENSREL